MRTALVVLVVVCLRLASARADEAKDKARALYESGIAHYNLSEYKEALADFKSAYRLFREPTFLFNIAQCDRQLHDFAAAAAQYRAYRRESPDAPNRAEVDTLIVEMDRQAATQPTATTPAVLPTTAAPATVGLTAAPPPRKPVTKKAWFWVAIGGAAVVVGAGVALAVVFARPQPPTASAGTINGN